MASLTLENPCMSPTGGPLGCLSTLGSALPGGLVVLEVRLIFLTEVDREETEAPSVSLRTNHYIIFLPRVHLETKVKPSASPFLLPPSSPPDSPQ